MIDVLGKASGGRGERVVTVKRELSGTGDRLTLWIHAPGAKQSSGCDIEVSMPEFLTALAKAFGGAAAFDPAMDPDATS